MKNVTDILRKFTKGELTAAEANAALAAEGAGLSLDPKKNELTEEEISAVKTGACACEVSGFGLLDTGTGGLDKVDGNDIPEGEYIDLKVELAILDEVAQ